MTMVNGLHGDCLMTLANGLLHGDCLMTLVNGCLRGDCLMTLVKLQRCLESVGAPSLLVLLVVFSDSCLIIIVTMSDEGL